MRDLADLTATDFEAQADTIFEVTNPGQDPLAIRLAKVVLLAERPGHRRAFSLRFQGPHAPVLPQSTHHVRHSYLGDLEIFLGPIASGSSGITYEAVFT
jgi:hypothetical protein